MAGLFDSLGNDPLLAARLADQKRQQELMQTASAGFSDPWGKVGATAGALLGSLGARWANQKLGYVSPEMQMAQKQTDVIKALQGADLSTSAGLTDAAKSVRDLGDNVTALKLAQKASEYKLAEAKLAREQAQQQKETELKQWNGLPEGVKSEIIAANPSKAAEYGGITDPKQLKAIQDSIAERNAFQKAKLEKAAKDLKKTTGVDVTGKDEALALSFIKSATKQADWGSGIKEKDMEAPSKWLAYEYKSLEAAARDRGETINPTALMQQAWQNSLSNGVIRMDKGWWGHNLSVDANAASAPAAPAAEAAPAVTPRQAPDGNWYTPDPARPGKYLMVPAPK